MISCRPAAAAAAADVHRSGAPGPKLGRAGRWQRRGRPGVVPGRGDAERREQHQRGGFPVRGGQSDRQRGPPVAGGGARGKGRSMDMELRVHTHATVRK